MKQFYAMAALLLAAASVCYADPNPLWLRDIAISPDGNKIAFCYKGDIYSVPCTGGLASRLTSLDSYESAPVWSPDGSKIAFASDRYGSKDIMVMDSKGGNASRLTFNSAAEVPTCFTPDGKNILFIASIQLPASSAQFPRRLPELYSVPVTGGKTVQVLGTPAESICYSPDGTFFLYQDKKGIEDPWRKHHISSDTRDIWRYDIAAGKHTNLTSRAGEDRNPVIAPDGHTVYFLSEPAATKDGHPVPQGWKTSINVYSFDISNPSEFTQISKFDTHPVRFLSMGGGRLCYGYNGEIYTQIPGKQPQKVSVDIVRDCDNLVKHLKQTSGVTQAAVSPDGKQVAFVLRGEVFVASVEYGTTKQITHTAAAENNVCFGKDGRTLVYESYRDGRIQLYKAVIDRKEDPNFANATVVREEPFLHKAGVERSNPCFSPDGRKIAFVEDRIRLKTASADGTAVKEVTDGSGWFSLSDDFEYRWSPDGKWFTLLYCPNGRYPYSDVGLVSAGGGEITNLTGSGYISQEPRFVLDGNAILFLSERYGMRSHASWGSQDDAFLCFLNQDAYDRYRLSKEDYELLKEAEKKDKKKDDKSDEKSDKEEKKDKAPKNISVELDGIQDRIVRLTPASGSMSSAIVSKGGNTLYYLASYEKGTDLWKMTLRSKGTRVVSKDVGTGVLEASADGKTIFLFGKKIKKLDGSHLKDVAFNAEFDMDLAAEREFMFDFVCREEQERFYDAGMHGVDWKAYTENYRRFLPHIDNNYDFSIMLSELLGELNVSHTGSRYYPSIDKVEMTAALGLLYDLNYTGKGLRVDEVIANGPCDKDNLKIGKGDVIKAIDGVEITSESDYSALLSGKSGKKVLLSLKGGKDIVVIPIPVREQGDLLYDRWVKQRAADVERLSGGRLGYVHLKAMNDASYRTVYSDILGKYNKCEGIVIDTRFNGGGRLHEDIEVLFSGEKYLTQVIRGRDICDMPSRRWNKPSIMIQGEANYSNAHGTPWVYRFKKIGKLVGAPVPGTMTSVNWVKLQDDSMLFGIPVVGYRTAEGYYLEDDQLEPDIPVLNSPEKIVKGEDEQLEAAVKTLLEQIDLLK